jgi:hypothetical protein
MPKTAWERKRVVRQGEPRTFEDPEQPGESFTLSLARLGPLEQGLLQDEAQGLIRRFVGWDADDPNAEPDAGEPDLYLTPDGPMALSRTLVYGLLSIKYAQTDEDPYDFEGLLSLSVRFPNAWRQVQAWAATFLKPQKTRGNAPSPRV